MSRVVVAAEAGRRAGLTLALCFVAVMCEGLDIQSMGLAAPRMGPDLHLARDQLGPLFSASIVGLLVGAVLFGRIADFHGRKRTLIGCLALFGLFSFASAFVSGFDALLAVRLITGLGLGGALPNLLALCAETVSPQNRTRLVTRLTCGLPFGGAIAGTVAANFAWRDIFYVGGAIPLVLAPMIALALPESPDFLAARVAPAASRGRPAGCVWILFGGGRAASTLLLWTASFASLLSLYVMLNWLPTLLGDRGLAKPQAKSGLGAVQPGGRRRHPDPRRPARTGTPPVDHRPLVPGTCRGPDRLRADRARVCGLGRGGVRSGLLHQQRAAAALRTRARLLRGDDPRRRRRGLGGRRAPWRDLRAAAGRGDAGQRRWRDRRSAGPAADRGRRRPRPWPWSAARRWRTERRRGAAPRAGLFPCRAARGARNSWVGEFA